MTKVSILTPTTKNRKQFLKFVAEGICKQDYKNILEWVLVDGTREEESDLEETIAQLRKMKDLPKIVFVPQDRNRNNNIGSLRNILNQTAKGDIMVCFDDDDYYFPKRISHAVHSLLTSKKHIAGCTKMYMYDSDFNTVYQMRGFGPNHGTGCTFAYTRKYLENHKFDESRTHAEESSFTNKFSEPMVQLDPQNTIINTSHTFNTFSKKRIIWDNMLVGDKDKSIYDRGNDLRWLCKDKVYLKKYLDILQPGKEQKSEYDIVYYCGFQKWDPTDKKLGGSEQAVILLSQYWVRQGYRVGVYGFIENEGTYEGVDYMMYPKFSVGKRYKVLILWRLFGVFPPRDRKLKADRLIIDMHDRDSGGKEKLVLDRMEDNNGKIFFKSDFHLEFFTSKLKSQHMIQQVRDNSVIVPNGIRKEIFQNINNIQREKYRFCYCSCYTRGLGQILAYFFPTLRQLVPQAELHVYYGMDAVKDEDFKKQIQQLLAQPGVTDHGRQPSDVICDEKYRSNFHLYLTESTAEIDCISIKESAYTGCIPILSNVNLYKDRAGIHISGDMKDKNTFAKGAYIVAELLKDDNKIEEIRKHCMKSDTLVEWDWVGEQWTKYF